MISFIDHNALGVMNGSVHDFLVFAVAGVLGKITWGTDRNFSMEHVCH
jgi:hypothetical protein